MSNIDIKIPTHIAFIMDGNGSWAEKRKLPRLNGHKAGAEALKKLITSTRDSGIKFMTVYAFSTENWNRSTTEVNGLMNIVRDYLKGNDIKRLKEENVRIRVIGDKTDSKIPSDILKSIKEVEEETKNNDSFTFNIAFNYGGRNEIINAIKNIPVDKIKELTEDSFSSYLYSEGMPDPDLIIRTSGQMRTSNFLIWQSAYSEYIFTDTLWPDFDEKELEKVLKEYSNRKRKFGKV